MSTRQLRLNSAEAILKKSKDLMGKRVNIVMNDQTVVLATIQSVNTTSLEVMNMRLKKVSIDLSSITEVYYDTKE